VKTAVIMAPMFSCVCGMQHLAIGLFPCTPSLAPSGPPSPPAPALTSPLLAAGGRPDGCCRRQGAGDKRARARRRAGEGARCGGRGALSPAGFLCLTLAREPGGWLPEAAPGCHAAGSKLLSVLLQAASCRLKLVSSVGSLVGRSVHSCGYFEGSPLLPGSMSLPCHSWICLLCASHAPQDARRLLAEQRDLKFALEEAKEAGQAAEAAQREEQVRRGHRGLGLSDRCLRHADWKAEQANGHAVSLPAMQPA